jgi:hypothetical protein
MALVSMDEERILHRHETSESALSCVSDCVFKYGCLLYSDQSHIARPEITLGDRIAQLQLEYTSMSNDVQRDIIEAWQEGELATQFGADAALAKLIGAFVVDPNVDLISLGDIVGNLFYIQAPKTASGAISRFRHASWTIQNTLGLDAPCVTSKAIEMDVASYEARLPWKKRTHEPVPRCACKRVNFDSDDEPLAKARRL